MRGLEKKVAVVSGAAPGNIGGAAAARLSAEGMQVVVADLNAAAAEALAKEINDNGGTAHGLPFDITDETSVKGLIDFAVLEFGRIDGLFNVAADLSERTIGGDVDVMSISMDVWQHTIDVNLTGYMYGVRHAMPIMIEQGGGSIINTMSSSVWMGETNHVAYQSSKSGLIGLTRHSASVGGKHGVRTNLLSPGVILTDAALRQTSDEWRSEILAGVRSPRLGQPNDIAGVVAFLFSDDAAYINGQSILVDGGANFT
jgi:NAD(P)-dependent dehydrogenase (short-subunit alcohol dehydrogenase family)